MINLTLQGVKVLWPCQIGSKELKNSTHFYSSLSSLHQG